MNNDLKYKIESSIRILIASIGIMMTMLFSATIMVVSGIITGSLWVVILSAIITITIGFWISGIIFNWGSDY